MTFTPLTVDEFITLKSIAEDYMDGKIGLTELEVDNIIKLSAMQHPGMRHNMFGDDVLRKINISRWPNGRHFYAKYDGKDVKVNGRMKWNTYEDAFDAAKEFREGYCDEDI